MPGVSLNAASLGQLSISFKQALANAPKADSRKNSVQLARVKRYVDDHFTENINRSSIARALGISYSYVGDLFQKEMKISLTEYLLNLRMERAMELLRQTRLSVAEIARRVCYVDSKSFIRAFQKKTGCTPGEWRILKQGEWSMKKLSIRHRLILCNDGRFSVAAGHLAGIYVQPNEQPAV